MGPLTYCAAILRLPAARCCLALSGWFLVQVPAGLSLAEPGSIGSLAAQTPPQDRRDGRRPSRGAADEFRTEVPRTPYDIVLGRPTDTSVTASILAYAPVQGHFEFGVRPGEYPGRTDTVRLAPGTPREVDLDGLEPDTRYFYRWLGRASRADPLEASREHSFHTKRASGAGFVFTVQADSHLDRTDGHSPVRGVAAGCQVCGARFPRRPRRHLHDRQAAIRLHGGAGSNTLPSATTSG